MPETKHTAAIDPPAASPASQDAALAKHTEARAELTRMQAAIDLDNRKIAVSKAKLLSWEKRKKADLEGLMEFDEPPELYKGDLALQRAFHAQHYVVADLEKKAGLVPVLPDKIAAMQRAVDDLKKT